MSTSTRAKRFSAKLIKNMNKLTLIIKIFIKKIPYLSIGNPCSSRQGNAIGTMLSETWKQKTVWISININIFWIFTIMKVFYQSQNLSVYRVYTIIFPFGPFDKKTIWWIISIYQDTVLHFYLSFYSLPTLDEL